MRNTIKKTICGVLAVFLAFASHARAQIVWGGGDGDWSTGANWTGGSVPNTANGAYAQINSGNVTFDGSAHGDIDISQNGTLEIAGGSWTYTGSDNWIYLGNHSGGTLLVDGGTFDTGTAGNVQTDSTSMVDISSGTADFNSLDFYSSGTFEMSGGILDAANFHPTGSSSTMSGGTINTGLISFDGGTAPVLTFEGGQINLDNDGFGGFYNGVNGVVNFTLGSTGVLFIDGDTVSDGNALLTSTIKDNGAFDPSAFNVSTAGSGINISLVEAVPEPSTCALLAIGALLLGANQLRHRNRNSALSQYDAS